jgi:hypothetical protein
MMGGSSGPSTTHLLVYAAEAPSTWRNLLELTACHVRRSFQNARTLAQDGAAAALLALLKTEPGSSAQLAAPLCSALRHIAVNDDICKVRLWTVPAIMGSA